MAKDAEGIDWRWVATTGVALYGAATASFGTWRQTRRQQERKAELDRYADALKAEQQREHLRFSLYEQKRQEVYAGLLERVSAARFEYVRLERMIADPPRYGHLARAEAERIVNQWRPKDEKPQQFARWDELTIEERQQAAHALVTRYQRRTTAGRHGRAHAYYHANVLYLSGAVETAAMFAFAALLDAGRPDARIDAGAIGKTVDDLRDAMRAELVGGPVQKTMA